MAVNANAGEYNIINVGVSAINVSVTTGVVDAENAYDVISAENAYAGLASFSGLLCSN